MWLYALLYEYLKIFLTSDHHPSVKHIITAGKLMEVEDHLSEKLGVKVDLVTPDALKPLI